MRARLVTAALMGLALLAGLVFLTSREGREVDPPGERTAATATSDPELPEPDLVSPSALEVRPRREDVPDTRGPAAAAEPSCAVLGRIVDEDDRPLEGVRVRLYAPREWDAGHDVPRLPGPYDFRGWERTTDAAGAFRFEVPVPTNERQMLRATPDAFHDSAWILFGGGAPGERPALRAGETDLGSLRLATTGAIRGFVVDEQGRPIEGAELDVGPEPHLTIERGGETDANGAFLVAHVKPGTHGLKVAAEGYLSAFEKPVEVVAGRPTDVTALVLRAAPALSGRVVDEAGVPLGGARVRGRAASNGATVGSVSEADGAFTLYLPRDEPHRLEVKLEGYETFGVRDRSPAFPPGEEDLEVVLAPGETTLFRVVDAATGDPIERFGLRVVQERNISYGSPPRVRDHPGGEVELGARAGQDRFDAAAEGYRATQGTVEHDRPGANLMTIRLDRGAGVTGRVVDAEGRGQPDVLVQVTEGWTSSSRPAPGAEPVPTFRVRSGAPTLSATTDAAGRFLLRGLERGEYLLEARDGTGRTARIEGLRLKAPRETKDVGDLVLRPGASVLGRVLVPAGVAPGGLKIYLDDWQDDVTCTTDGEGGFRFDALAPGTHELRIAEAPGRLAGLGATFEVAAGEAKEVVLDARENGMCAVTLTVLLGDDAVADVQVQLLPLVQPGDGRIERLKLGHTDENGRVLGSVRAAGEAEVRVFTPGRMQLLHATARIALEPNAAIEETVRFPAGPVIVRVPDRVAVPARGRVSLRLTPVDEERWLTTWQEFEGDVRDFVFEHVPAGTYTVRFELTDDDGPRIRIPAPAQRVVFDAEREVTVRDGAGAALDLR